MSSSESRLELGVGVNSCQASNSQQSYRQTRRLHQLQRVNNKKTRGITRGIKWKIERSRRLGSKPSVRIESELKRVTGENADQFITEVGILVRNILPLDCRNWREMDNDKKERLFARIKAEWNLPEGDNVHKAVVSQCKAHYRQWRYRLKEKYFEGFSIADAVSNVPPNVDPNQWKWCVEIYWSSTGQKRSSIVHKENRSKQKMKAVQGSKSTARILEMLRKNHQVGSTSQSVETVSQNIGEGIEASQEASGATSELPPPMPEYIRLWEMTKRHKDNSWDKLAEQRLEEFKELHAQQVLMYGVDNLTVKEAYMKVLGASSGYINGLGPGPKPARAIREASYDEGMNIAHQMAQQIEHMENMSREREARLKQQLEEESKKREDELKEKLEKDSKEREDELRKEIKMLQDGNGALLKEMERIKEEAIERNKSMHEEMQQMQKNLMAMFATSKKKI